MMAVNIFNEKGGALLCLENQSQLLKQKLADNSSLIARLSSLSNYELDDICIWVDYSMHGGHRLADAPSQSNLRYVVSVSVASQTETQTLEINLLPSGMYAISGLDVIEKETSDNGICKTLDHWLSDTLGKLGLNFGVIAKNRPVDRDEFSRGTPSGP